MGGIYNVKWSVLSVVVALALVFLPDAQALNELPEFYRGVRATGMGNAFTAIADDADAVFYNPAGIAFNNGVELRLINPKLETSADSRALAGDIRKLSGSGFNADAMNALFGKNIYGNGTIFPSLMVPYLTVGYYADFNVHAVINNKANPRIDLDYYYDQGFVAGTGFETGGIGAFHLMRFGLSTKLLTRRGVSAKVPITSIVTGSDILSQLQSGSALGIGITPGMQYEWPMAAHSKMLLGVAWQDVGDTKFGTRLTDSSTAPPPIVGNLAMGAAFARQFTSLPGFGFKVALEGRHLNLTGQDPRKKIHGGGELNLGLVSLRAGLSQLNWTAGVGIDLLFIELAASSYAVESLPLWGQSSERRYAVQLTIKLDASVGSENTESEKARRKRPRLKK